MDIQFSEEISAAYLSVVRHILENEEFLSLYLYSHHQWTNRLMHSVNVSYISWKIAKKLGCDEKAAARAGLLHDFCPYDFSEKTPTGEHQAFFHHMFPLGPVPKNSEAWIITLADKICATLELCHIAVALARRNRIVIA